MTQQISPFIEAKYGWDYGESGWNTGMDENLLKFSFLFNGNLDGIATSLPPALSGQAYFLSSDNRLYFSSNNSWYSSPTPKWKVLYLKATGNTYQFDGNSLNAVASNTQLQQTVDSINVQLSGLGTASTKDIEYFASSQQLDIASAEASSYTDASVLPLQTKLDAITSNEGSSEVGYLSGQSVEDVLKLTKTPYDFSAVGDGVADDTLAIQAWAQTVTTKNKRLPAGTYKCSAEVIFNPGDYVYGDGDSSVLDFSAGVGGALKCVSVTGALVALPNLASNISLRSNSLPFVSTPSLSPFDVILIWNPTDSSWSPWRPDYRAGEWCRAAIVTGNNVSIFGRTYDEYTSSAVQMYKLVGASTTFRDFKIKQPPTSNAGLVVDLIDSPVVHRVSASGGIYAGIDIRRSIDVDIDCKPKQASAPSGNNYGLAIGNSQGGTIRGVYYGTRHSISLGGSPGVGSVSCRDIDIYAAYKGLDAGINSVDLHGNTEDIRFHGVGAQNGFVVAGKNNSWYGGAAEGGTNSGIAVYMGEVVGGTFNFVGLTVKSSINPNTGGNGVMSFQNFSANVTQDCNFIFTGLVMKCPAATTFPILFALNGTTAKIGLSFPGGITFESGGATALTQVLRLRQFSTTGSFSVISLPQVVGAPSTGCAYVVEVGGPIITKYILPRQVGSVDIAVANTSSLFTSTVSFPHAYPRAPVVSTSCGAVNVGGKRVTSAWQPVTGSGFTASLASSDVASFTSSATAQVSWSSELSEQ